MRQQVKNLKRFQMSNAALVSPPPPPQPSLPMHTFVAVSDALVEAVLAAVFHLSYHRLQQQQQQRQQQQQQQQQSAHSSAPTLRSNSTTSGLFQSMAYLRGVLPLLQAGG
jgi:hypothetical protein